MPVTSTPKLILMIVADQLRADHTGFGGLSLAQTPNLDRLAERSMVFNRAHVTNPTCMPSRATLATGRWPSAHGTRTNGVPLDPTAETLMKALRRDGWHTAAIGKLHLQTMGWPAEDFQITEIAATNPATADLTLPDARAAWGGHRTDWEDIPRHREGWVEFPDDYYGFASVDLVSGHGDAPSGHYWHWVRSQGFDPGPVAGHEHSARPSAVWDHVWESGVPAEFSTTRFVTEHTVAQIEAAARRAESTFVFASFPDPHHPFCPPPPYSTLIDPADVELPATFNQDPALLPPHLQHMLANRGTPHPDPMLAFAVNEQQYREAMVHEVGLMKMIDDGVGDMLAAVDRAGLRDETLVVFTADHGDLFGDHGLMLKHHVHYEGVTRVPMVVAGSEVSAGESDALVSNADLVPTLLDAAAVTGWRGMQGKSLSPLLSGSGDHHREAVLVEEDLPFGTDGITGPVRMRTLITDDGRLTLYHGESYGECYRFADDEAEEHNLFDAGQPSALEREMRDQMLHEVLSLADEGSAMLHGA